MREHKFVLRTWLVAAVLCSIAACNEEVNPLPPEPTELVFANNPKVTFKGDGEAVVAYQETTERGRARLARLRVGSGFFETGADTVGVTSFTRMPNRTHALGGDAGGTLLSMHASGVQQTGFPSPGFIACRSTTAAPNWDCKQAIDGIELHTTIAMAGSGIGLALVGWSADDDLNLSRRFLQSMRHSSDFGWTPAQDVAEAYAGDARDSEPAVVIGAGLTGYALYLNTDKQLVARRYDGLFDRWEGVPLSLAEPFADQPVASARLVLHRDAPNAGAMALYIDAAPRNGPLIRAWRADGPSWRATPNLPGSECAGALGAAMAANGDVLVVWRCDDSGHANAGRVFASRYSGGVWSDTPEEIGAGAAVRTPIKVAVDAQGNGVAVWRTQTELIAHSMTLARGWLGAQAIGNITIRFGNEDFDVAMDDRGRGLAAWVRDVDPNAAIGTPSQGTRVAQQEVGPFALSLSAQRHTFGGEPIALTVRLGSPAPPGGALVTLNVTLPSGTQAAGSVGFSEGQSEIPASVATSAVADFTHGRIEASYGGLRSSQPITLMPEPTELAMSVSPASVLGGETASLSVAISPAYPVGLEVQLASDNLVAPLPFTVTTPGTATLQVPTTTALTAQSVSFSALLRGRRASTVLQVNPTALGEAVLTVVVNGQGSIGRAPGGFANCAGHCTASYPLGTQVTLTALPDAGSNAQFFAWEGDPDCSDGLLDMQSARTCTAIFLPRPAPYPQGSGWTVLGAPIGAGNMVNPSPALALNGLAPVVAYVDTAVSAAGVAQLQVRHLQANNFAPLGLQSSLNVNSALAAGEPAIVTSFNGQPHVAWVEGSGAQRNLYVARLAGNQNWVTSPALNYAAGSRASSPSIALDEQLRPMVAWIEDGAVKFKRFDGSAWVPALGGEGPASAGADRVRLASGGQIVAGVAASPVIAWTEGAGMARALRVVRDFSFSALGTQVNPASLRALTEFGVLWEGSGAIVTWGDGDSPFSIRSQRWNGSAWADVTSNNPINNNPNRLVSLAVPRIGLYVAYNWAYVPLDQARHSVSYRPPGSGWLVLTPEYASTRDGLVGPVAVELPNDSPITLHVSRDAAGAYRWTAMRYFQP